MIGDVIAFIDFLQRHKQEYQTKSALFSWDGTRLDGSSIISVIKVTSPDSRIWFYKITEVQDYEFVYMPVIPSLYVDNGQLQGETNPDARIFRFVGNPLAKFSSGGEPNVKANFVVIAYRPRDLLTIKEGIS